MSDVAIRYLTRDSCDGPFGSALTSAHYAEEGTRVIRLGNIGTGVWRDDDQAFIPSEYAETLSRHRVSPGEVVIAGLGDGNHPLGRACAVPDHALPAIVKADCYRLALDDRMVDSRFFVYAMNAVGTQVADRRSHGATRSRLPLSSVLDIKLPLPPLEVQRRVADMLDGETARIDALVAKNEHVAGTLLRRDVALAAEVVTHRAAGSSPSRHSTAFWIGQVPSDWAVLPLGLRYRVQLGKMLSADRREKGDQRPYLANVDVQWDWINTTGLRTMDFSDDEWSRYGVEAGDVLICEGGDIGRAAVWPECGPSGIHYQKALHRARAANPESENSRWLYYCLFVAAKTGVFQFGAESSTIDHLTGERLWEHRFPFPPRKEQDRLVAQLDAGFEDSAQLRQKVQKQSTLLKTRRQALITAAVSGQITV